ncbi:hypothetical protein [Gloeocapsopsis dulcis]|uniref:Outer membrane protein beta-barrel domain-containing protein n=1 Tax=Gloeocapsopsis dulcis AAB1 = 1H9 TaxID=1433147 RepID=A0A6N8G299_9CHRO|nr:hypothetical protein [Gloeocapsopsis dulcis]MUL39094.1 hypothetical protein [Gloeocapsopsis dulcis AAB1 = 1H9]WNN88632.1 hypothetical protein P0S91_20490 [Gloeocapsopsis dulcis]
MNATHAQRDPSQLRAFFLVPLLSGVAVAGSGFAVCAETVDMNTATAVEPVAHEASLIERLKATNSPLERIQSQQTQALATPTLGNIPAPGTTATSSAPLTQLPVAPQTTESTSLEDSKVAQIFIDPGQPTIGGSSYIGVAGNIGLSDNGSTALGGGNFAIISKIGLTNTLSTRPSVVLGDNAIILVPVTYDFSFQPVGAFTDPLPIAPYVGGGVAISTGEDSTFGAVLTGGIDVPITAQLTATAALNVAFIDNTDLGILIGVGYNFGGLGF